MKKSIIIASIIIVLALIGGGVFWYVKQRKKEINPPVVENNNLEEEQKGNELQGDVVGGGEEIDTSDWLTYRNEEYGFELKYPEKYTSQQRPSYGDALNMEFVNKDNNLHISLIISPLTQYIKDAIDRDQQRELWQDGQDYYTCRGEKDNYSCYLYREEDGYFYKYDNLVQNNKRSIFSIRLNSINQDVSPSESINSFLQNQFNPQDRYLINILEQIKASMIFF